MKYRKPDFTKYELIPAIVQDTITQKVLMLGYMNEAAFQQTINTQLITFFSRSKNRLWVKGETSKHFLHLVEYKVDCDNDSILILAKPDGPTCHTGDDTCFQEKNIHLNFLQELQFVIKERKINPKENSYTTQLLNSGMAKIAQKVGEEAVETVIEAMKPQQDKLKEEAADLLFHLLVLLEASETSLDEVMQVLQQRHNK